MDRMYAIGIDYHKRYSQMTVMEKDGTIVKEGKVANRPEAVKEFLGSYEGEAQAAVEATLNWTVIFDMVEELLGEGQVKLCHTSKARAIAEARIKTDTLDSRALAHLLRTDLLPEAHVRPKKERAIQQALRQRMFFVRVQTMVKNRIHVLIDRQVTVRETAQGFTDLFGKAGMEFLRAVELPGPERELLDGELALLEAVRERIAESNALIHELAEGDPRVPLVESIPGLGSFFSVLVAKEIGEVERFASPEKLCSYAGLVPSVHASGGRSYTGRITKQGNKWLRWALVEAVAPAIRTDAGLRGYYERIKRRKGVNSAKVATARRLLTIVYRCLKENRVYEERLPGVEYGHKSVRTAFSCP